VVLSCFDFDCGKVTAMCRHCLGAYDWIRTRGYNSGGAIPGLDQFIGPRLDAGVVNYLTDDII
jgi:hypothetical protein